MLGRTDSRGRMFVLLIVFVMIGGLASARLGYWQIVAATELAEDAVVSMTPVLSERIVRAPIWDRDGVVLAQTAFFDRLDAHPKDIHPDDHDLIVTTLTSVLGLNGAEQQAVRTKLSSDDAWTWLERRLTHKQSADIRIARDKGDLPGISLAPQAVRSYSKKGGQGGTTVASHLMGFVSADGRGSYGVERMYDGRLTGEDPVDPAIASIGDFGDDSEERDVPPLILTIDYKLQKQLERELAGAKIANKAKSASAIIMDPYTGKILAMASVPAYNANDFAKVASDHMNLLVNPVVSAQYEPGSVMKIFTASAALDQGVVTPSTRIQDQRAITFYDDEVTNADLKSLGPISVKEVIARSRNVATAKIAKRLAPDNHQKAAKRLYDFWKRVGMTEKTGVDIANEASGAWYDPKDYKWAPVDLANRAFGQGVSVTLLQLATGVSTFVNGGFRVQPHVVAEGDLAEMEPERVITAKVARQATDIMQHVTGSVPWYARGSLIPGYMIGGKTGTAQIWDPTLWNKDTKTRGAWKDRRFNHSFVGFVGGKRPEAVIAIRLEEPKPLKVEQGNLPLRIESYELFQMIARGAIKHLDIRKSKDPGAGRPILGTYAARVLTPDRNASAQREARRKADRDGKDSQGTKATKKGDKNESNAKRQRGSDPDTAAGDGAASAEP